MTDTTEDEAASKRGNDVHNDDMGPALASEVRSPGDPPPLPKTISDAKPSHDAPQPETTDGTDPEMQPGATPAKPSIPLAPSGAASPQREPAATDPLAPDLIRAVRLELRKRRDSFRQAEAISGQDFNFVREPIVSANRATGRMDAMPAATVAKGQPDASAQAGTSETSTGEAPSRVGWSPGQWALTAAVIAGSFTVNAATFGGAVVTVYLASTGPFTQSSVRHALAGAGLGLTDPPGSSLDQQRAASDNRAASAALSERGPTGVKQLQVAPSPSESADVAFEPGKPDQLAPLNRTGGTPVQAPSDVAALAPSSGPSPSAKAASPGRRQQPTAPVPPDVLQPRDLPPNAGQPDAWQPDEGPPLRQNGVRPITRDPLSRARELLFAGNIAAARTALEPGVLKGQPAALLLMARSFDPTVLAQVPTDGALAEADVEQAIGFYRRWLTAAREAGQISSDIDIGPMVRAMERFKPSDR